MLSLELPPTERHLKFPGRSMSFLSFLSHYNTVSMSLSRIGDSPIIGSGAYADSVVGGAAATGDGDVMMRFLPSFLAVEEMRRGRSPLQAAEEAIRRVASVFPGFFGGIIVVDKNENVGAACHGMDQFPYSIANSDLGRAVVRSVNCLKM